MSKLLLVEFEDQEGRLLSEKMQVPSIITVSQLKSLINTTLSLFINGTPIIDTLENAINVLNLNSEEIIKIRTTLEEPSTQAATFCSSSYSGHEGPVLCIKYEDFLVTGGSDCTVRFWDVLTKTQKKIIKKHSHWVQCLDISPCKKFVISGSINGEINMYTKDGEFLRSFIGHRNSVINIQFAPNNRIVSISRDKSVKIFDYDGKCIFSYAHNKSVTCLKIIDESIITGSKDGKIKIYNKTLQELNGHANNINCLDAYGVFMASGSDDGNLVIWKNNLVYKRVKHEREVISVSINGTYCVSGSFDKSVRIWLIDTGKLVTKYLHVDFVYKVQLYNDLIISCSRDRTVKLYRMSKKKVIRDFVCDDEVYCFDYYNNQLVCGTKSSRVYFFN